MGHISRRLALIGIFLTLLTGCAHHIGGRLSMVSQDKSIQFQQSFTHAYIYREPGGDIHIALAEDELRPTTDSPDRTIPQDSSLNPRQLVHLRILWTPSMGIQPGPGSTNSAIHWRLLCDHPDQLGQVDYRGSGFVRVSFHKTYADVQIVKAWMQPGAASGAMSDAIGASIMKGSFRAIVDADQMHAIMAQIGAINPADSAQAKR